MLGGRVGGGQVSARGGGRVGGGSANVKVGGFGGGDGGLLAGDPRGPIVDGRARGGFGSEEVGGGGFRWLQEDRKGCVKLASKERAGGAVDEAADCVTERPAEDGVDRDVVAEGEGEVDRRVVGEGTGKNVGDDSTEETMEVVGLEGVGVFHGT